MGLACKICILNKGLRGDQVRFLPQTRDELFDHMEREHHVIVQREGESYGDSLRRVLDNPETCTECRESARSQLEGIGGDGDEFA